jgi:hypothetical protein
LGTQSRGELTGAVGVRCSYDLGREIFGWPLTSAQRFSQTCRCGWESGRVRQALRASVRGCGFDLAGDARSVPVSLRSGRDRPPLRETGTARTRSCGYPTACRGWLAGSRTAGCRWPLCGGEADVVRPSRALLSVVGKVAGVGPEADGLPPCRLIGGPGGDGNPARAGR